MIRFALFVCVMVIVNIGWAQTSCSVGEIKYEVKKDQDNKYSIVLTSTDNVPSTQIRLVDLFSGEDVQITKTPVDLHNNKKAIFTSVNPSRYVILLKIEGCMKEISVKGKGTEGILVGEN